jgi:hypothetical protein
MDKTALTMRQAVVQALGGFPARLRRTITYASGLGNTLYEAMNRELV